MAVVHKWYINGRHPKILVYVVKYLVVGWLLYLVLCSRSEQADNEFLSGSRLYELKSRRSIFCRDEIKRPANMFWQALRIYSADDPISNRIE